MYFAPTASDEDVANSVGWLLYHGKGLLTETEVETCERLLQLVFGEKSRPLTQAEREVTARIFHSHHGNTLTLEEMGRNTRPYTR